MRTRSDKVVLTKVISASELLAREKKYLQSPNLALVLVHDLLLSGGIQAGDGPVKQAVLRHKTRLHAEFQKIKIRHGVRSNLDLAQGEDARAGNFGFNQLTGFRRRIPLAQHRYPATSVSIRSSGLPRRRSNGSSPGASGSPSRSMAGKCTPNPCCHIQGCLSYSIHAARRDSQGMITSLIYFSSIRTPV
jgi:hypothetical protein